MVGDVTWRLRLEMIYKQTYFRGFGALFLKLGMFCPRKFCFIVTSHGHKLSQDQINRNCDIFRNVTNKSYCTWVCNLWCCWWSLIGFSTPSRPISLLKARVWDGFEDVRSSVGTWWAARHLVLLWSNWLCSKSYCEGHWPNPDWASKRAGSLRIHRAIPIEDCSRVNFWLQRMF